MEIAINFTRAAATPSLFFNDAGSPLAIPIRQGYNTVINLHTNPYHI